MRISNSGNLLINTTTDNGIHQLQLYKSAYVDSLIQIAVGNSPSSETYIVTVTDNGDGTGTDYRMALSTLAPLIAPFTKKMPPIANPGAGETGKNRILEKMVFLVPTANPANSCRP